MKHVFITILLALVGGSLYAQSPQPCQASAEASAVSAVEFWVDEAIDSRTEQPISGGTISFAIETQSLREGFHILYYRLKDDEGVHSAVRTWHFFVYETHASAKTEVVALEYWMDSDIDNRKQLAITEKDTEYSLEITPLEDGAHTLYYRLLDNEGKYSAVQSHSFEMQNPPDVGTGIPVIINDGQHSSKFVDHHHVFILTPEGRIYDAAGMQVK